MRRVAITGVGVVSPIGLGRESFWESLAQGVSGIDPITRFDAATFEVRLAGEVKDAVPVPEWVAAAAHHDPKIAFAYAACAEAIAHANLAGLDNRTLLHLATGLEVFDLSKLVHHGSPNFQETVNYSLEHPEAPLQMPLDSAAELIQRDFGRAELALTNCSACAASTQAIGHAFQAVRAGRFDRAICGGFDSMINPLGVGGFQLLGALTVNNDRGATACRPFDSTRNGTVLGEGAAALVLEPLDRVRAEGRPVLGEICGYGSTLDAFKVTAPDPEGLGAQRAIVAALEDARIAPAAVQHINAHGTSTHLNDAVEAHVIRKVFDGCWKDIPVTATKSMTGHLIGACGAVEVVGSLLAFARNVLPPNPTLTHVGDGCELCHVMQAGKPFNGEYVLKESFGFGGQNAVLVLRRS